MLRGSPLPPNEELSLVRQPCEENCMKDLYKPENRPMNWFDELFGFRREFDDMFNRIASRRPWTAEFPEFKKFNIVPAVETYVDKEAKKYICKVTLPGVELKDVEVHAQNNLLTIRGERKITREKKEVEYYETEIAYGVFERTLPLPEGVLVEKLTAEYTNGVLEITAPVAAVALPRKIEIKSSVPFTKQIAA
jgi:HSP20 family protein